MDKKISYKDIKDFLIETIKEKSYYHRIGYSDTTKWRLSDKNSYVLTGGFYNKEKNKFYYLIGKVVQVRKYMGAYSSHLVLLRLPNNKLQSVANAEFHRIEEKYYPEQVELLNAVFSDVDIDDADEYPYIIDNKSIKGFIVENANYEKERINKQIKKNKKN